MRFLFVPESRGRLNLRQPSAAFPSLFVLALVLVGCSKSDDQPAVRAPTSSLRSAGFYILQTELSPATLVFSTNKYLSLFTGLDQYGRGAPSYLAFATRDGPRAFTNGTRVVADHMDESWLLVWFAGAKGWTNGDVPWAIFLQRKPASMKLDGDGLHLGFRGGAEHVVLLPLYGSDPLPLGSASRSRSKEITTSRWHEFLTKEVLMRVRYWAGVVRQFPISASIYTDRSHDAVTVHCEFDSIATRDDWNTRPLKLVPIPPSFAIDVTNQQSAVQFSAPVMDLDYVTPSGPYNAIQDIDEYSIKFPATHLVNQTHVSWSSRASVSATNTAMNPHLLTSVHAESNTWPRLIWPVLKTSTDAPWTFGHISPGTTNSPKFRIFQLNRNTQILLTE